MSLPYILIVATFLNGYTTGPVFAFHPHASLRECQEHAKGVMEVKEEIEASNFPQGQPHRGRVTVVAKCKKIK